ncbi:uncharacterized protein DUF2628 [Pseudoduganella lurida]|uniref:Uncharacterized protein DUF2628 n=1 Tax=Pseudoduganella lurida TaxID=1036180 RepID=A0A562R4K4_9BURK|nr:DUF2628 domain-containing protein [Pseudoduganella lurida]TWI63514.1 uncharacterized protein DUF2628 [Pseudoduganella lurida]
MVRCEHCNTGYSAGNGCFGCGHDLGRGLEALSPAWRRRFALIEQAGGPTFEKIRTLPLRERFRAAFNVWALFFGPFYFMAKGMWKRAITLTVALIGSNFAVNVILAAMGAPEGAADAAFHAGGPVTFAAVCNLAYYKAKVLGDWGWW